MASISSASVNTSRPLISHPLNELRILIEEDMREVDRLIELATQSDVQLIPDMGKHIVSSGGKRLRPILTLLCAKLCQYEGDKHTELAAAVELLHTATLLHDDVVDNSAMRRGEATANHVWDNKSSVLVGDYLLGKAFCLMVQSGSLRALDILSRAASVIAEGEVMQLVAANNIATSQETYISIITAKTAMLFSAACEVSPVLAGKTETEIKALRDFGLLLGIAFQIVDDALDYSAEQEKLGKAIGDDFREGKVTLPVILAYTRGSAEEQAFWRRAMTDLVQQPGDLEQAIALMKKYDTLHDSIAEARNYVMQGIESLSIFPDSVEKAALETILSFSVEREY